MNNEKKYETLADLYNGSFAFRLAFRSLVNEHDYYLSNSQYEFTCRANDTRVFQCLGVLDVYYFDLKLMDCFTYQHFYAVIRRYMSYNVNN